MTLKWSIDQANGRLAFGKLIPMAGGTYDISVSGQTAGTTYTFYVMDEDATHCLARSACSSGAYSIAFTQEELRKNFAKDWHEVRTFHTVVSDGTNTIAEGDLPILWNPVWTEPTTGDAYSMKGPKGEKGDDGPAGVCAKLGYIQYPTENGGDDKWYALSLTRNSLNELVAQVGDTGYETPPGSEQYALNSIKSTGSTTSRLIADRFAEVINVKDFGAKGDGTTNDLDAIQHAFDRAAAINGKVVFPTATYFVDYVNVSRKCLTIKNGIREIDFQNSTILFRCGDAFQWLNSCFWLNEGSHSYVDGIETIWGKSSMPSNPACDIIIKNVTVRNVNYTEAISITGQTDPVKTKGQMWRAFCCYASTAKNVTLQNVNVESVSKRTMIGTQKVGGCNLIYLTGENIKLLQVNVKCAVESETYEGYTYTSLDTVAMQFGWVKGLLIDSFNIESGDCSIDLHYSNVNQQEDSVVISNGTMRSTLHSALSMGCWSTNGTTAEGTGGEITNISLKNLNVCNVVFRDCNGCVSITDGRNDTFDYLPCEDIHFVGCTFEANSAAKPNDRYGCFSAFHSHNYSSWNDDTFYKKPIAKGVRFDSCIFIDTELTDTSVTQIRPPVWCQSVQDIEFSGCRMDFKNTKLTSSSSSVIHARRNANLVFQDCASVNINDCDINSVNATNIALFMSVAKIALTDSAVVSSYEYINTLYAALMLDGYNSENDDIEEVIISNNSFKGRDKYTSSANREFLLTGNNNSGTVKTFALDTLIEVGNYCNSLCTINNGTGITYTTGKISNISGNT